MSGEIDETMTVNRVIRQFPGTRPVFEQLLINLPMEGCTCLDELAWCHGMTSSSLVNQLEERIKQCGCGGNRAGAAGRAVSVSAN